MPTLRNLVFGAGTSPDFGRLTQNHVQQGSVDFQVSVVFDESQFAEFVREKAHTRPCSADHFGERLLVDFRYDWLWPTFLAKIGHQ
jgi:hypothetical protein